MRRSRAPALLLAAAMALGPRPAPAAVPGAFTTRTGVAYGPSPAEQGDLFLPSSAGPRLRPAVLVIHGGGWVGGERATNAWLSGLIASNGFVAFNIDYRLAEAAHDDTHWPAQLADAQLAVRWLRANAAALKIDPARIGAIGDSAGGTLAVLLGVLDQPVPGPEAALLAGQRTGVAAVVDQFGITDLAALGPGAATMVHAMFGAAPAPGLVESVSPLPAVSRRSAPMRLVHGDNDQVVPLAQSERLAAALQDKGIEAQLVTYHGGHGYEGVAPADLQALFMQDIAWLQQRLGR